MKGVFCLLMIEWMLPLWYSTYQFGLDMHPMLEGQLRGKKSSTNSTAWLWFWDVKETQNSQKWKKILSHIGGLVVHRQKILPYFGWIGYVCQVLSPRWLKILFHFWQFWVPFISQNHNQAVELVELFFPLSYSSNIGWLRYNNNFWNNT